MASPKQNVLKGPFAMWQRAERFAAPCRRSSRSLEIYKARSHWEAVNRGLNALRGLVSEIWRGRGVGRRKKGGGSSNKAASPETFNRITTSPYCCTEGKHTACWRWLCIISIPPPSTARGVPAWGGVPLAQSAFEVLIKNTGVLAKRLPVTANWSWLVWEGPISDFPLNLYSFPTPHTSAVVVNPKLPDDLRCN